MAKIVKVVLVGCGGMSGAWLKGCQEIPGVQTVGLVDIRRGAAEARAQEYGLSQAVIGTDLAEVLRRTAPDMVYDCTVPEAHCEVTLVALKHGCHVLGEKPLADSMASARKMVGAAARAKKLFAVIQNRRYQRNIRSLAAFLRSGKIGALSTVNADFYIGAHFGGFRDHMRHPLLLDMAIHSFDQARLIMGTDAKAVYCKEFNPVGSWYDHAASAMGIFETSLLHSPMLRDLPQPLDTGVLQRDVRVEALGDGLGDEDGTLLLEEFYQPFLFRHQRIDPRCLPVEKGGDGALLGERWQRVSQVLHE
jgi:predicted dehydrogenase